MKNELYSVQAAAALAGVPPGTLRMWEQRYGVVSPARTEAGHRRYGISAVERLKALAALVRQGHAIGTIATLSDSQLRKLLDHGRSAPGHRPNTGHSHHLESLQDAITRFDVARAANHLKWLRTVLGARAFVLDVAVPLFATIGNLVAESRLDVSQEHAISAVLRAQIGELLHDLQALPFAGKAKPPVIFASPEDDRHEFGILLGAVLAGVKGVPIWYGGADLPAKSLANAVKAVSARHIVLGNAPVPATERRVSFESFLVTLDSLLPAGTRLSVGGSGDRPCTTLPSGRRVQYLNSLLELDAELDGMLGDDQS